MTKTALIVGAGSGISASFARLLAKDGYRVALASRDSDKLTRLAAETKDTTHPCDAADPASVDQLFAHIDQPFPQARRLSVQRLSPRARAHHCWSRLMAAASSRRLPLRLVEPLANALAVPPWICETRT